MNLYIVNYICSILHRHLCNLATRHIEDQFIDHKELLYLTTNSQQAIFIQVSTCQCACSIEWLRIIIFRSIFLSKPTSCPRAFVDWRLSPKALHRLELHAAAVGAGETQPVGSGENFSWDQGTWCAPSPVTLGRAHGSVATIGQSAG